MKKALTLVLTAGILTAGLAGSGLGMAYAGDSKDKAPKDEVRAIGEATNCVNTRSIRSTKIVDKNTIDFKMIGGKTYRNTLPHSCGGLRTHDAFSYRTSTGRLCNVDIISVVENFGGLIRKGASCGLGKFQQIEKVKSDG